MNAVATPSSKKRFTAFRCPDPILHELQGRAAADGRSLSNLIVYILTRELRRTGKRNG